MGAERPIVHGEEKQVQFFGRTVSFRDYCPPQSSGVVLMLHGWGASKEVFDRPARFLAEQAGMRVVVPDFPGFGQSSLPEAKWNTERFVEFLFQFLDCLELPQINLVIGHSHGGRVSLLAAVREPERFQKLLLVGSAGLKRKLGVGKRLRVFFFKCARRFVTVVTPKGASRDALLDRLRSFFGSSDYRSAPGVMRDTLVTVLNEDLRAVLSQVAQPTLLVWGSEDDSTPLEMGKIMESLIPNAGLVVWEGAGHYAFIDRPDDFERVALHFLTHD